MTLKSFDLFDTLVTRVTPSPVDVFRIVGASEDINFRWMILGLVPFHRWRRLAERIARRLSPKEDILLSDIYRVLGKLIHDPARIMRREARVELACIYPIPEMATEFEQVVRSGTRTCIISDMYLPSSLLSKITRAHLEPSVLHVSSRYGLTKSSGNLFLAVAKEHGVDVTDIHHHGDNRVSDYSVPRSLGITATLVPAPQNQKSSCVLDCLNPPSSQTVFSDIGFRLAGPVAFTMAACLAKYVAANPAPNIVFAGRDMYLVKAAFDQLSTHSNTSYCPISRSAVYRARWHANPDPWLWFEGVHNGKDLFARLGRECPDTLLDVSPHTHSRQILEALVDTGFEDECRSDFEIVRDYLAQHKFEKNTLFVDLGWNGSIQDAINDILPSDEPIRGYYFGTISPSRTKHGLYFQNSSPARRFHRVMQAVSFFEFCFTEPTPSVARIRRERTGDFSFVYTSDETDAQIATRREIEDGALAYLSVMHKLNDAARFRTKDLVEAMDVIFDRYLRNPPVAWVEAMDSMTHSGGFGGSATSGMIGDEQGNPLGFLKAPWKGGYLVKHSRSPWHIVLRVLDHPASFTFYSWAKRRVRNWRRMKVGMGKHQF